MPTADYACSECGHELELSQEQLPDVFSWPCTACRGVEPVRVFRRLWRPVAIGQVKGAGGSPSRGA